MTSSCSAENVDPYSGFTKFSLRNVEPSINRSISVLRIDIDRLHRHKKNIEQLRRSSNWQALNKEQINTSRTVQQLKGNLRGLERIRAQVQDSDVDKFDKKVHAIHNAATATVQECIQCESEHVSQGILGSSHTVYAQNEPPHTVNNTNGADEDGHQQQAYVPTLDQDAQTEALLADKSWSNLLENLEDLNDMMHSFAQLVHSQQEVMDRIEDNVESAHTNVHEGTKHLANASKYKAAMYPAVGALVGGLAGGPVGLLAGLKLGAAAALGGGIVGFTGGRFWKKRQDKLLETEMKTLDTAANCDTTSS